MEVSEEVKIRLEKIEKYLRDMAIANDREPTHGWGVYSGPAAFNHSADLVGMVARGEPMPGFD